jgi:hypothetical protein
VKQPTITLSAMPMTSQGLVAALLPDDWEDMTDQELQDDIRSFIEEGMGWSEYFTFGVTVTREEPES